MTTPTDQGATIPPQIAAILQNLSNRPNVEFTLILSRKDGSIINATGALSSARDDADVTVSSYGRRDANQNMQNSQNSVELNSHPTGRDDDNRPKEDVLEIPETTEAENLASHIMTLVNAATSLGFSLKLQNGDSGVDNSTRQATKENTNVGGRAIPDDETNDVSSDHEVQLLRLRTKRKEVIIFPDANFLCCVVQNVGRMGH